jgi:hypothetical protein
MEHQGRLPRWVAADLPVDAVVSADIEQAVTVRLDRRVHGYPVTS